MEEYINACLKYITMDAPIVLMSYKSGMKSVVNALYKLFVKYSKHLVVVYYIINPQFIVKIIMIMYSNVLYSVCVLCWKRLRSIVLVNQFRIT